MNCPHKQTIASKTCVLIPAYNCEKTIENVITSVLSYTADIIVVNDGSTDNTEAIINKIENIVIISYPKNKGKGYALKKGFDKAVELGYISVITMDADGQHFAEDLCDFFWFANKAPQVMLIGNRAFDHPNMPKKNVFANKFSNFWFTVQTLRRLPDTQSGFRHYPLLKMKNLRPFTNRFEAETELLVRCAWRGFIICKMPIKTHYFSENETVSHFRPKIDFARISLLNACLCIIAFFYGYPLSIFHLIARKTRKIKFDYKSKRELINE